MGGRAGDGKPETEDGDWNESLSIAETNKLRAQLGLKPLDVPAEMDRHEDKRRAEDRDREAGHIKKGELSDFREGDWNESLSVAATNELRARLGLKPLEEPPKERQSGPGSDNMTWAPATGMEQGSHGSAYVCCRTMHPVVPKHSAHSDLSHLGGCVLWRAGRCILVRVVERSGFRAHLFSPGLTVACGGGPRAPV